MVAVLILPIMLFAAFAVDVGHWWVHKRHLQTQADAGALAAALGPWLPACDNAAIEAAARTYASDLGSGYNPQYTNAANVHVLINSASYWNQGGTDYSEDGKTPCETLFNPTPDPVTGEPKPGYVDVKATEADLPNIFGAIPGFSFVPAINRHARIEIQQQTFGTGIRPIAVRDSTAYQCAEVVRYSVQSGAQLGTPITLTRTTGPPTTPYAEFQNGSAAQITMPGTAESMYVRARLYSNVDAASGACAGSFEEFPTDDSGNPVGGVNFINVYSFAGPNGASPALHSVTIGNGGCSPDQYFSYYTDSTSCGVTVIADVEFPSSVTPSDNPEVEIDGVNATPDASLRVWTATFSISAASGPHTYDIRARYNGCGNACPSFGIQQQAYSGLDDDGEPSSSGPISMLQIGENGSGVGANSFERGTTHDLVFTLRVVGLENSRPTDKPIVLRFPVQGSKRTGVVDCGQGNGASEAYDAIINGCPRPVYIWPPGSPCVTPTNSPSGTPIDCVGIVPGNRRQQIARAFADRIGNSCNNWNAYRDSNGATPIPAGDLRLVNFIITSPVDLSGSGGSIYDIPILLIATFYVTGADGLPRGNGSGCDNEAYPGTGRDNFAVWGHWIKWANVGGSGSGQACVPNQFGACVAVLTR
jgi:hypothetical protein